MFAIGTVIVHVSVILQPVLETYHAILFALQGTDLSRGIYHLPSEAIHPEVVDGHDHRYSMLLRNEWKVGRQMGQMTDVYDVWLVLH